MIRDKQHSIKIEGYHIELKSNVTNGYFILYFYGTTEKGKRYKIEIKFNMYFVKHILKLFIGLRGNVKKMLDEQFGDFKNG